MTRKGWLLAIRTTVSAGLLVWLVSAVKWRDLAGALTGVDWRWLGAAVFLIIVSVTVSVVKWRLVLRAQGLALGFRELWNAYWAGLFFNNFLPSSLGGDAARILWAGRIAKDPAGAATSVVVERILATCGLALTGLIGAAAAGDSRWGLIGLLVALLAAGLALLALILYARVPGWCSAGKGLLAQFFRGVAEHGSRLKARLSALLCVLVFSAAFQVCVVAVNYAVFRALRITTVTWWDALYLIPVASAAAMVPVGINGYGLREGAYVALLGQYRVAKPAALASSLVFTALVTLCSLYGGLIWLFYRGGEADRSAEA